MKRIDSTGRVWDLPWWSWYWSDLCYWLSYKLGGRTVFGHRKWDPTWEDEIRRYPTWDDLTGSDKPGDSSS